MVGPGLLVGIGPGLCCGDSTAALARPGFIAAGARDGDGRQYGSGVQLASAGLCPGGLCDVWCGLYRA